MDRHGCGDFGFQNQLFTDDQHGDDIIESVKETEE